MDNKLIRAGAALVVAWAAAGCASEPQHPPRHYEKLTGLALVLARFADSDGNVTRAAMEEGLRKDFDAADLDHDGVLQPDEVRPLNDARAAENPPAPRIVDWNGNGVIDFKEYVVAPHALFDQLDSDGDDVLTPDELQGNGVGPSGGQGHSGRASGGSHRSRRSGG